MRTLGIDYGRQRFGLSISDASGILATPLSPYRRSHSLARDLTHLANLIFERHVTTIVVGLPLHMNGSHGEMASEAETFARALRGKTGLPTELYDERLTSSEAERVLLEADVSRTKRKALRDSLAATLILQGYLDRQHLAEQDAAGETA